MIKNLRKISLKGINFSTITLKRDSNQALGLAQYAIDFMNNKSYDHIHPSVLKRVTQFHTDSAICGISALALRTNAPNVLREQALSQAWEQASEQHQFKGRCFGSYTNVPAQLGIAANCSAVRQWDSNGTVFGYNPSIKGHQAGQFGHNDYYPVVIAACLNLQNQDGSDALRGMLLIDEIRGRLAQVFSLKSYKIDHVVHGAIASAVTYGAMLKATPQQIQNAIGLFVAHYIPFRAIRAGKQLSDSKGASAALSTEMAIKSMHRAMKGFSGPKDIFRNPEAIFRLFEGPIDKYQSPFDLTLTESGKQFAVMGMHFKLGLYEHQSAGAIHGITQLIAQNPSIVRDISQIQKIKITAYEPAYGIIGDIQKRNPLTRQSADHSMVYIIATLLRKAIQNHENIGSDIQSVWKQLLLTPFDYNYSAIRNSVTKEIMNKIQFEHGGEKYDKEYPQGIPTSVKIQTRQGKELSSGLIKFPIGHSRYDGNIQDLLSHKFMTLGRLGLKKKDIQGFVDQLNSISTMKDYQAAYIYDCDIKWAEHSIDSPIPN